MATPQLTKHSLPGRLGPILVDVRASPHEEPRPAVLILHGFKGFKDWGMFPPFAERLARAGFTAVSFNVSGSGVDDAGEGAWPELFGRNTFSAELDDLDTVLGALDAGRLGVPRPSTVGLVGHSRGGGVSILAAHRTPRIAALVTWSAVSTLDRWGPHLKEQWRRDGVLTIENARTGQKLPMYTDVLDEVEARADTDLSITAAARVIEAPWLVIHGEADETVPVREATALIEASGGRAELLIIPHTGHTFGAVHPFAGRTPALEQVFDASADFLIRHLS